MKSVKPNVLMKAEYRSYANQLNCRANGLSIAMFATEAQRKPSLYLDNLPYNRQGECRKKFEGEGSLQRYANEKPIGAGCACGYPRRNLAGHRPHSDAVDGAPRFCPKPIGH